MFQQYIGKHVPNISNYVTSVANVALADGTVLNTPSLGFINFDFNGVFGSGSVKSGFSVIAMADNSGLAMNNCVFSASGSFISAADLDVIPFFFRGEMGDNTVPAAITDFASLNLYPIPLSTCTANSFSFEYALTFDSKPREIGALVYYGVYCRIYKAVADAPDVNFLCSLNQVVREQRTFQPLK